MLKDKGLGQHGEDYAEADDSAADQYAQPAFQVVARATDWPGQRQVERAILDCDGECRASNPGKEATKKQSVDGAVDFNGQECCKTGKVGDMCTKDACKEG